MNDPLQGAIEPFAPLAAWLHEAEAHEPRVPNAMQLATVGADSIPSLRTVLLKDHGPDGLTFYTNLGSQKALELRDNPAVALLLHFKSLERQILAQGDATLVEDALADAYWATRPRGSQLAAWASQQSRPIEPPGALQQRLDEARARFGDQIVPRPPFWSGYRIQPHRVEFWQGRPDRLHTRIVFERAELGWRRELRYP
ncbi:MAG TPA: pyridoxamine 5'-phosphate oxidase [Deltaproteobacteria bacterium]|nr:pyridoxamine 5'-phosphate oxidase [Deltaproteobacteria bacterium]